MLKYSIVVPFHNEQENVTDLYARLKAVMEANGETFEMVLVDDGSKDETFQLLREIALAAFLSGDTRDFRDIFQRSILPAPALDNSEKRLMAKLLELGPDVVPLNSAVEFD